MSLLVGSQIRGLRKSLVAPWVGTEVRLFSGMSPQMSSQIKVKGELLPTEFAFKGFFSSMHQLMPFKLRIIKEPLPASLNWTYVLSLPMSH